MTPEQQMLISQLNGLSGWDALVEYIQERRVALMTQLAGGYLDSADYLRTCGEIKGLDAILTAPSTPDPKRPASRTTTSRH